MTWTDFANRFYAAYQRQPERSAIFAYDAARLALTAWRMVGEQEGGDAVRRRIGTWLAGVEAFEGIAGPVDLTGMRVNDNVYLLQIRSGEIVPWHAPEPSAGPPGGEGR